MQRQQEEHQRQLMELQAKHRRELSDKEAEHQKEVSFLKSIIQKAKKWFPLFQELQRAADRHAHQRQAAVLRRRTILGGT